MDSYKNLNNSFFEDLDTNFNRACVMCEKDYTHTELVNMLKNGNIPEKQIAALKFDSVKSESDAKLLLDNLTGCDGKIREAVALRINQILNEDENSREIFASICSDVFAAASIDINANICRLVVDSAVLLINYTEFAKSYTKRIYDYINESLSEIEKFIFRDKKYVINKQIFKLYWCLEALIYFYIYLPNDNLERILSECSTQKEYTIREKVAQIVVQTKDFSQIRENLAKDENYYVRQIILNH